MSISILRYGVNTKNKCMHCTPQFYCVKVWLTWISFHGDVINAFYRPVPINRDDTSSISLYEDTLVAEITLTEVSRFQSYQ